MKESGAFTEDIREKDEDRLLLVMYNVDMHIFTDLSSNLSKR